MKKRLLSRRLIIGLLLLPVLYLLGIFVHGWSGDWQPGPEPTGLKQDQTAPDKTMTDSVLTLVSWNVGYGGLGAESDFFYDDSGIWYSGSSMIRSPKSLVEKNLNGVLGFLDQNKDKVDFFLLQEVDIESDRSYNILQYAAYQKSLPGFAADFAVNYQCDWVPVPLLEPWNAYGAVLSGLATFSRYQPTEATRHQLPGHYPMPDRMFQLDRCAALHRYPTTGGKDLVVINLHNSAYDPGDKIKAIPYVKGKTFETLIDFFLISPNLKLTAVRGIDQDYRLSDHHPVTITITLL